MKSWADVFEFRVPEARHFIQSVAPPGAPLMFDFYPAFHAGLSPAPPRDCHPEPSFGRRISPNASDALQLRVILAHVPGHSREKAHVLQSSRKHRGRSLRQAQGRLFALRLRMTVLGVLQSETLFAICGTCFIAFPEFIDGRTFR